MFEKLLVAAAAATLTSSAAFAADLPARTYTKAPVAPVVAAYDWSGFYIGANGGGGSAHECWSVTANDLGALLNPAVFAGCHNATGGTAGGQVGYRWQMRNWVFGVEAQGNWADFKATSLDSFFSFLPPGNLIGDKTTVNAFGLFTGQVGYAVNNVLFYAKGGAAVTNNKHSNVAFNPFGLGPVQYTTGEALSQGTETRWGGVVGVGVEYGFAPNWSVAVEYNHLFMGTSNVPLYTLPPFPPPVPPTITTNNIRQDVDIGTIRVNYRFGGPVVAKY